MSTSVPKVKRDEQMTILSFIGNAGGLLGLCMGLSMISIVEIIFYCAVALVRRCADSDATEKLSPAF
jgi:hypothetical protein